MNMSEAYGIERRGLIPTIFIGDNNHLGYRNDETTGKKIKNLIERCMVEGCIDPIEKLQKPIEETTTTTETSQPTETVKPPETTQSPEPDSTDEGQTNLLLFTVTIGIIDGFNACSIWAFCLLMGLLLRTGSRKRMIIIGATYIFFSGLVYLGFLTAWLGFNLIFPYTWFMRIGIGLAIIIIGLFSLKDFFTSFRGPSFRIPDSKKPAIYKKMRRLVTDGMLREGASIPIIIVGVASLAFTINLVELLCTAGLPAAYTRILVSQNLSTIMYYFYLLVYILFYMIDELFLLCGFALAVTAFRIGETYGRISRLIAGWVMIWLGLIMMFWPELLAFTP